MSHTILRLHAIKQRTGLSRASIYLRMSKNAFPKQISLGGRAVGWLESEIESWLSDQIAWSRSTNNVHGSLRRIDVMDRKHMKLHEGAKASSTSNAVQGAWLQSHACKGVLSQ